MNFLTKFKEGRGTATSTETVRKAKFCAIAPFSALEVVKDRPMHLVIANFIKDNDTYRAFYANEAKNGAYIILDNGTFETGKPMSIDMLVELAKSIGAKEIVAPDVINDYQQTVELTEEFFTSLSVGEQSKFAFMTVPQGKNLKEYIACMDFFHTNRYGKVFGITKGGISWDWKRTHTWRASMLWHSGYNDVPFHLLGMPDIREVPLVKDCPWLRSMDSSLPFKYALNGYEFTDNVPTDAIVSHMDWNQPMTETQKKLAVLNTQYIDQLL